jgi:antitoxin VapB
MTKYAPLFQNGRSQAVRLPKEFRFDGAKVRISRTHNGGVLLEPEKQTKRDIKEFIRWLEENQDDSFMADGRQQPDWPPGSHDKDIFD